MSELTVGTLSGLAANGYVIDVASGSKLVQPGSVLQVVSTTKDDVFTTSSTSYTDVTSLSASITPSSISNKILVTMSLAITTSNYLSGNHVVIVTDGDNNIISPAASGTTVVAQTPDFSGSAAIQRHQFTYLHSPATTSAFTYKVRVRTTSSDRAVIVNRSQDSAQFSVSTITAMEIAG